MARLNLTLDADSSEALDRHARRKHVPKAALARELLREAIARRESIDRQKKLAGDYARARTDARELLTEIEAAQVDLLEDE